MDYGSTGNTVNAFAHTYRANKDPFSEKSPFNRGQVFLHGQRIRLNAVSILLCLFAPWLLFCLVFYLVSFRLHYWEPSLCLILVVVAFMVGVVVPGALASKQMKKKYTEPDAVPMWYTFLAMACLLSFCVAASGGEYNYVHYMQPFFDYENLAVYTDVDSNQYVGQQLMDAGRINFKEGTALDLSRSMGFRNTNVYCVAPIVTKNSPYNATSRDFWAVGKNCCSGTQADFHCKGFSDPYSTGALRLINQWDRPFYRLAVQQAEATYKIAATHPLFFEWVRNADEEMYSFEKTGYKNFLAGICSWFLVQGFLTWAATLAFSKLVHA